LLYKKKGGGGRIPRVKYTGTLRRLFWDRGRGRHQRMKNNKEAIIKDKIPKRLANSYLWGLLSTMKERGGSNRGCQSNRVGGETLILEKKT